VDADGEPDHDHPIVPAEADLPVDPAANPPAGFTEDQRGEPGGFVGDPDIFDTWATSSLSPQIAGGWRDAAGTGTDPLFEKVFPMDVRPQGHDIIRIPGRAPITALGTEQVNDRKQQGDAAENESTNDQPRSEIGPLYLVGGRIDDVTERRT
jgi:hypothetical protein